MQPFEFISATDEPSAIRAADRGRFLADGTTLADLIKLHVERPTALVDINPLPLTEISERADGGGRVGAMVRNSDMARHENPISAGSMTASSTPPVHSPTESGRSAAASTISSAAVHSQAASIAPSSKDAQPSPRATSANAIRCIPLALSSSKSGSTRTSAAFMSRESSARTTSAAC
jgi:hypothetical protein